MKSYIKGKIATLILLGLSLTTSEVFAQLKIESVYPALGVMGQDLEVTMKGSGFDENTRISMYLDVGNRKAIIGWVDTQGYALDVKVVGEKAYVGAWAGGFKVIDISNPANPQIIGSVNAPAGDTGGTEDTGVTGITGVAVLGNMAYVTDMNRGLQVIDISNPTNPRIIGSVATPGSDWGSGALRLAVLGNRAYVANGDSGLQVIDISNPANPQIVGSIDTLGHVSDVIVVGNTTYVAASSGLKVIDISNPSNPQIIGSVDTLDARSVAVVGNTAYVTTGASLKVIDISNPANPQIVGSADTPGDPRDIAIANDRAYVADDSRGLKVIDISNPVNPQMLGSFATPGGAWAAAVVGDIGYVADGEGGLQVIDISNPTNRQILGSIDTPGWARGIAVVDYRAYVADQHMGLQVIDISNPANPQIIGSVDTPGNARDIAIVDDRAYVADDSTGLQVVDVSNPANPQIIGSVDTPGSGSWESGALAVAVFGNRAYVANSDSGLQVIDISNPANPQIVGSVDTPGYARGVAVASDKAYVADGPAGLQVIDISNPSNPRILGSVVTSDIARDVKVVGDRAYVADYQNGGLEVIDISNPLKPKILGFVATVTAVATMIVEDRAYLADTNGIKVIDISNPANPQILASFDTAGTANDVAVVGDIAFVADGEGGLTIVPLPVEVTPVTVNDSTSISVTLPTPKIAGHYTLRVSNGTQSYELPGAVTFLAAEEYEVKGQNKAIIVAGGGPYPGNDLWEATRICANLAYLSLLSQGYTRENIYYLSPKTDVDVDGDGLYNDIDNETTSTNLSYAINEWAKDASEVLIYVTDHGGIGTFELNGTKSPREKIDVETLDAWLDDLQGTIPGRLIFIYDACNSGSFVSKLSPPAGKERIVITSALADQRAWFMSNGALSFSYQFWASVFLNANLYASYMKAGEIMKNDQTALLDVNGNGIGNEKEDRNLANNVIIGRGRVAASLPPVIGEVELQRTGQGSAVLRASTIDSLNPIARAWAVITPPDYDSGLSDEPVVDLPTVELLDSDQDGVYEGVYEKFNQWGTYRITFYAKDTEDAYSLPKQTTLTQEAGPDRFENDDTHLNASVINIGDPQAQRHNFHDPGDQDWVKFYAVTGENYEIKVENVQSKCDAVVVLYDRDGTTRLTNPNPPYSEGDSGLYGGKESITWACPADGIYHVMVKQYLDTDFGPDTGYDLKVYRPSAAKPGFIKGRIADALDVGISGAVLRSNIVNATALTTPEGYYLICLPAGTYTVTAQAQGYPDQSFSGVTVNELSTTNLNFSLPSLSGDKKGDMNKDNNIDLTDLIIALKALTGQETTGLIRDDYAASGADVNGDNKVGMHEAIYILQKLSGLR